jgi:hypothetical protein
MYTLTTLDDLRTLSSEARFNFVQQASLLSGYYEQWKAQDNGGYTYQVDVAGSKERAPGIHASEISKCLRRLTYSISGEMRKPPTGQDRDVNMQMRFNIGHAVHGMLQHEFQLMCAWLNEGIFKGTGWSAHFMPEVRIHPGVSELARVWNMHSSCDGVFCFDLNGETVLRVAVEIKTKSGPEFDKLRAPEPDHVEQAHLYQAALNVPLLWFVYYNKSNSNFTKAVAPYLIQFSDEVWDKRLVPRFTEATEHANKSTLPGRAEGMFCRWCPFAWTCNPPSLKRRKGHSATKTSPNLWPTS